MTKKELKKLRKDVLSDVDHSAIKDAPTHRTSAHQTEQMRVAAVLAKQPEPNDRGRAGHTASRVPCRRY